MFYTFISNSTLPINRQLPAGLRALTSSCMKTKTASPSPHSGILQSDCWVQIASLILKGETLSTEMMKMSLLPSQKKLMNSIKLFGSSPLKNLPEYIFEKNSLIRNLRNIKPCKSFLLGFSFKHCMRVY